MSINIFGVVFHPYGLILGVAVLVGWQASLWLAKRRKISVQSIEGLFWWVVVGGIVGARLYHVIDKWQEIYSLNPQSVFYVWNGGLGIWGAIVGGIVGLLLFLQKTQELKNSKTQDFVNMLDVVMFGMPLGQAIGRWGNFFNNEIVGRNGEPLFLYESLLSFALFVILVWIAKKDSSTPATAGWSLGMTWRGGVAGAYLVGYGVIRFLLEPLRPEAMVWKIGGMPTASIVSTVAILTGICLIFWRRRS